MPIVDKSLGWLRQSKIIHAHEFSWFLAAGPTTASSRIGSGVGAVAWGEVVDGLGAPQVSEADDEIAAWDLETLRQADVSKEIGVRVFYTIVGAPTANDAVTWKVFYNQFDLGGAIATPATALDTVVAAQTNGGTTQKLLKCSSRGIISANKFDLAAKKGGLAWKVEADAITTYTATQIHFLGLEIDYVPQLMQTPYVDTEFFKGVAAT